MASSTTVSRATPIFTSTARHHQHHNSQSPSSWRIPLSGDKLCLRFSPSPLHLHQSRSCSYAHQIAAMEVPDYLPVEWKKAQADKPLGPRFDMTASEAVSCQLEALRNNDHPHADYGIEVMYRFAGFDPFERSSYFGPSFDLGQFERFRRIFHHSTYRILLGHTDVKILSSLFVNEHCFKQRVSVRGARPDEEEIFEFTLIQRVGGCWDGYWLTDSLRHDGEGISGGIAY